MPEEPKRRPGRPPRIPHPLEARIADRFSPTTVRMYGWVFGQIEESGLKGAAWLRREIAERAAEAEAEDDPSLSMPKKTLMVYRPATALYIHLVEQPDHSIGEIVKSLPTASPLREGVERPPMTDAQLKRFRELADDAPEPQRTILLLLPLTGCRISEICTLERRGVDLTRRTMTVHGKGAKARTIEIGNVAWTLLSKYVAKYPATGAFVFGITHTSSGAYESSIRLAKPRKVVSRDVWRVVSTWEDDRAPGGVLEGVCLHQTRHTAATAMIRGGAQLTTAQGILGHKNIQTLARYVHPGSEERLKALGSLE